MADSGLFIGWGEVVRGREAEAVERFNETIEYFAGLQADGRIESFEPVFLEPYGGDLQGYFFVRGDAEKLAALRVDEEFAAVIMRAGLIVDNIGVVGASMAARLERQMQRYAEAIGAFALLGEEARGWRPSRRVRHPRSRFAGSDTSASLAAPVARVSGGRRASGRTRDRPR